MTKNDHTGLRDFVAQWARTISFDASSILNTGLLALLIMCYAFLIYTTVLAVGLGVLGQTGTLSSGTPWWLDAIAFALVVAGFMPVSRWLSARVNGLVYGEYDDPYRMLAKVNRHLQSMTNPAVTLPLVAEEIALEMRLPFVAIQTTASKHVLYFDYGEPVDQRDLVRVPITHLDQVVGEIVASYRKGDLPLSESDLLLLRDLEGQIGAALYAAGLTAEVQGAREQLVSLREDERRRIRNNLHDGLAPTLASLGMQLGVVRRLLREHPDRAEQVIDVLREDVGDATAEIRRLVYDLRPPMLDEIGLVAAIGSFRLPNAKLQLEVVAPTPMPPLSAATEVAVYRIALEAIHNVVKHTEATICSVVIAVEPGVLTLRVTDNGHGSPAGYGGGVGVKSMQERAIELGGTFSIEGIPGAGTRVDVRLPHET